MIILDPISPLISGFLVNSNVPETDKPNYNPGTTYSAGTQVLDPTSHQIYESKVSSNLGQALTDTTKWLLIGSDNRWKMFDGYNGTQTTNPDSIVITVAPQSIAQGLYLGNLDANDISIITTDPVEGVVHTETQSLIVSDSNSSFYNWLFKRIRRKTYFITTLIPVYYAATTQITINKIGSTPKCGMFATGPLINVGLSQYGLSSEIKDYSSTTFNFDGTSSSIVRGYAKRMSIDIVLDNDLIDAVQEQLADFRQKNVLWLGAVMYGSAIVFGKYSSFKNVIADVTYSKMNLQIEGTV